MDKLLIPDQILCRVRGVMTDAEITKASPLKIFTAYSRKRTGLSTSDAEELYALALYFTLATHLYTIRKMVEQSRKEWPSESGLHSPPMQKRNRAMARKRNNRSISKSR